MALIGTPPGPANHSKPQHTETRFHGQLNATASRVNSPHHQHRHPVFDPCVAAIARRNAQVRNPVVTTPSHAGHTSNTRPPEKLSQFRPGSVVIAVSLPRPEPPPPAGTASLPVDDQADGDPVLLAEADVIQLGASSGNNSARSTESAKMATSRTLRPKAVTGRTSSTTRATTHDTFPARY